MKQKNLLNLSVLVGSLAISGFLPAKAAELMIAEVHPITGPAAFYGLPMSQAIQLAVEQINASGGIKAGGEVYSLRLISGDTQGSPTIGVAALRKVLGEGAKYVIGPLSSGVAPALKPIIDSNPGVTQIIDGTIADGLLNGRNVFRNQTTIDGFNGPQLMIAKAKRYSSVALMTDRFHSGNMTSEAQFVSALEKQGNAVVDRQYFKLGDTDFSAQLTNIVAKKPEALMLRGYPNENALMTKQARQLGYRGQVIWAALAPPATVTKNISNAEMNGVLNGYPPEISDYIRMGRESARVVGDAFKKKFGTEPGELSALSYDAVFILKSAIEKAGSIQNEAVNAALFKLKLDELPKLVNMYEAHADGRLFNNQGQVLFPGTPHIWSDGKWLPYDLNQK